MRPKPLIPTRTGILDTSFLGVLGLAACGQGPPHLARVREIYSVLLARAHARPPATRPHGTGGRAAQRTPARSCTSVRPVMPLSEDQPAETAASVRNVGAVASLSAEGTGDPDFDKVDLCLFASTDTGDRVHDPEPPSASLRIERSKLAGLELSVQMSLRLRQAPTGARLQAWERITGELATRGIQTDPATLHGLGFALVLDDELKAAQAAAGR